MYAFYARGMRRMMKQYQNAAGGENKCKGKSHYKYSDGERERESEAARINLDEREQLKLDSELAV